MSKERVLIVDDEPDVLRVCERILSADGYSIKTVSNGFEAVQLAGSQEFDLLLTDIKMPGMDGLDVAEAARTVNPHLVCVTMTGYSTMDTAIEALKLGIEEFIIKPFTPQDLITAVSRALEKERLRRESARLRALLPLFEANKIFMSTTEVTKLAQQVVEAAARELKADRGVIFLYSGAPNDQNSLGEPHMAASLNVQPSEIHPWLNVAEAASQLDSSLLLDLHHLSPALDEVRAASLLACTINAKQGKLGVLAVAHDETGRTFSEGDREFLSVLCGQVGIAIENASLFEELRHAYEELKQLDYMKSEFISIAAHELRTPLAILMGYAGILEGIVPPDTKQYATIILRNAGRLRALMDEMLNLDALERGSSFVRLEAMSLAEVVSEIVDDLRPLADTRSQTITVELPQDELRVTTDREKFGMILANLLSNAIKFTPEGGAITVRTSEHPEGVLVEVADTGIGIPVSEWQRIFERFYQVEDSLTREHEGMGLGLSIAKGMVELLGGRIWLESEVGRGSVFRFTVPLSPKV
ncbi:MAG: ATP-binding protein [Anaerolineae bacterium]